MCLSFELDGQDIEIVERHIPKETQQDETKIVVDYSGAQTEQSSRSISSLSKRGAVAAGLLQGTDLINRSIDSFMELLFYSILDQDIYQEINRPSRFGWHLRRQLIATPAGGYVVMDEFGAGPEYQKNLRKTYGVIPSVGSNGRLRILDIYYRTDAMRYAQAESAGNLRHFANNWLGMLPIIGALLPPSFNPNELYDPIRLLENPVTLPLSEGQFLKMETNSIRSYSVSGSTFLGTDFLNALPENTKSGLNRADEAYVRLPYSVYLDGTFRINVFKKNSHTAWVSLNKDRQYGHKISGQFGRAIQVLERIFTASWWKGVTAGVLPIDFEWDRGNFWEYMHAYSFDMRDPDAIQAYVRALKGDFRDASTFANRSLESADQSSAVKFLLKSEEDGKRYRVDRGPNIVLLSHKRSQEISQSEIALEDRDGRFNILRASHQMDDVFADTVTGKEDVRFKAEFEVRVRKVGQGDFQIDENFKKPRSLRLQLEVNDRFTNAQEYREYVSLVRDFVSLPLKVVPVIPRREISKERKYAMNLRFQNPRSLNHRIHVTPTYLGRMAIQAEVSLNEDDIQSIMDATPKDIKRAVERTFNVEIDSIEDFLDENKTYDTMSLLRSIPLESLNYRSVHLDEGREIRKLIQSLYTLQTELNPLSQIERFYSIFKTAYPVYLTKFIVNLLPTTQVGRRVLFFTSPKGRTKETARVKELFGSLDRLVIRSISPIEDTRRSRFADTVIKQFKPRTLGDLKRAPIIKRVELFQKEAESKVSVGPSLEGEDRISVVKVKIEVPEGIDAPHAKDFRLFLRLEDAKKLKLGSFLKFENIIVPKTVQTSQKSRFFEFQFDLSGVNAVIDEETWFGTKNLGDGDYKLNIAAGAQGLDWSPSVDLKFSLLNQHLIPYER